MFVMSQEGALLLWQYILGIVGIVQPTVHLMGSSYNPLHTSTLTNFAANELAVANGYAPKQLTSPGANWSFTTQAAGELATYLMLSWTFTASLTVYGAYISDDGNLKSWGGQLFTPSYAFPAGGGLFTLLTPLTLLSCPGLSAC
jgi:hypothetical protein